MTEEHPKQPPKRRFSSSRSLSLGESPVNHNCLQEHPFFKERDPRLFELLLGNVSMKVFHPGVTIVWEGEEADCMYFLHHGEVEVLIGAEEKRVAKLGDGDLFGEMALLGIGKRAATVRALTFCFCRSIDANAFRVCLQRFPTERIYFGKLAAEQMAARNNLEVYVNAKPITKLRTSVHAVRSLVRRANFRSCPPLSAADSLGQEEELLHPCTSLAATSTGFAEDVSEASCANVSHDPRLAETPQSKQRSSTTWHKRKFTSIPESSLCHGSEGSSDSVDPLSYDKDRHTFTTQFKDCPDDLRMTTCIGTSQPTDCLDDKWMTEPSERFSFTALSGKQSTTSRFRDPMRQEVQDSTPTANNNIVNSLQTVPLQMKLNSTRDQEAPDQESVGNSGNYDATDREVSSGQGDSLSNRFDAAKSPLQLIPKPKHKSASCQDTPAPSCLAKAILVDVANSEKIPVNEGSRLKRRSLSCTAAKSGPPIHLPPLNTKQRAMATWRRT